MNLKEISNKMSGILGRPEKPMGRAQLDALKREIESLDNEYSKLDLWTSLASCDTMEVFKVIIQGRIEQIKEQYSAVDALALPRLQVQHGLLREMLYSYLNAGKVKQQIVEQMNEKRRLYDKAIRG